MTNGSWSPLTSEEKEDKKMVGVGGALGDSRHFLNDRLTRMTKRHEALVTKSEDKIFEDFFLLTALDIAHTHILFIFSLIFFE